VTRLLDFIGNAIGAALVVLVLGGWAFEKWRRGPR